MQEFHFIGWILFTFVEIESKEKELLRWLRNSNGSFLWFIGQTRLFELNVFWDAIRHQRSSSCWEKKNRIYPLSSINRNASRNSNDSMDWAISKAFHQYCSFWNFNPNRSVPYFCQKVKIPFFSAKHHIWNGLWRQRVKSWFSSTKVCDCHWIDYQWTENGNRSFSY